MIENFRRAVGRYFGDTRGSLSIVFGAAITSIVLSGAAALDYSNLSSERTRLRGALDSAVLAATKARWEGNPNWRKLGENVLASNYPQDSAIKPVLTVDGEIVRASITRDVPLSLGGVIGIRNVKLTLNSAATVKRAQANACILTLDPTSGVKLSGLAGITSNCGIHSNGSSSNNFSASGGSKIVTNSNTGVGGSNTSGLATITPAVQANAEFFPDPLASLPEPVASGTCRNVNLSGINTVSFPPGRYCQFQVSGIADITLQPGIHTFETTMNLSGSVQMRGTEILVHLPNGGRANLTGVGLMDLRAMTSGPYSGIVLYQSRSNNARITLDGLADLKFNGVIYAPAARFQVGGGGGGIGAIRSDVAIIVNDIDYSGVSQLRIQRDIGACGPSSILPASVMAMCKGGSDVGVRLVQ